MVHHVSPHEHIESRAKEHIKCRANYHGEPQADIVFSQTACVFSRRHRLHVGKIALLFALCRAPYVNPSSVTRDWAPYVNPSSVTSDICVGPTRFKKKKKKKKIYGQCLPKNLNLSDFYSYRLIGKLIAFLQLQEFSQRNFDRGQFHFRRAAFSAQLKSKVGLVLVKAADFVELEHLKIKTRLTNEKFASVKGECEI